jgi:hypothetical protein
MSDDDTMIAFVRPRTKVTQTAGGTTQRTGVRKPEPEKERPAAEPIVRDMSDTMRADAAWTAADLQAYVLRQIERLHGPQPDHEHPKMRSIFTRFLSTWGTDAARIARYVFEVQPRKGYWKGAPVKATRFTKGNDEYFARAVLDQINR